MKKKFTIAKIQRFLSIYLFRIDVVLLVHSLKAATFFYLPSQPSAQCPEGITAGGVHLPTLIFNKEKENIFKGEFCDLTAMIPGQRSADLSTAFVLNEELARVWVQLLDEPLRRDTVTITIPGARPVLAKMAAGIFLVTQH